MDGKCTFSNGRDRDWEAKVEPEECPKLDDCPKIKY